MRKMSKRKKRVKVIKNEKNKSDLRIRKREKVREIEVGERVIMRVNG